MFQKVVLTDTQRQHCCECKEEERGSVETPSCRVLAYKNDILDKKIDDGSKTSRDSWGCIHSTVSGGFSQEVCYL